MTLVYEAGFTFHTRVKISLRRADLDGSLCCTTQNLQFCHIQRLQLLCKHHFSPTQPHHLTRLIALQSLKMPNPSLEDFCLV